MPFSPTNVASFLLSGAMGTTLLIGIGHQAQAENLASPKLTPPTAQSSPSKKVAPAAVQPNKVQQVQTEIPDSSIRPAKKGATVPRTMEPFIRADAVALGQWLMTKTVKTLVGDPVVANAAKPTSTASPTPPSPASRPATAAVRSATRVAVRALPPEPSNNPTIDGHTEMRVALTKQAGTVTVATSQGGAIISTDGQLLENLPAGIGYRVSADASGLSVNGQPIPTAVWLQSDNGYVAVGDRWYRGRLLLLWQDGGVMAVNYVLLQDYLYSVVGAEMSASWSLEALKAQAVAARSYALVHSVRHQRRAYDLDDTQRYQAYKGVATEASSTHQAVHNTAGEFISYGGGVVESLYAANQDIVNDAHSGYGMSQTGALDLAQQGYRYYEILATYYPDTSVGRIDIGN